MKMSNADNLLKNNDFFFSFLASGTHDIHQIHLIQIARGFIPLLRRKTRIYFTIVLMNTFVRGFPPILHLKIATS